MLVMEILIDELVIVEFGCEILVSVDLFPINVKLS